MERQAFSGLTRLDIAEPISDDNYSFQHLNPKISDYLLRLGAKAHVHDAHAGLATPSIAPVAAIVSGSGTIPADTPMHVGYTLLDSQGGETDIIQPPVLVTTPGGLSAPTTAPTVALDTTAGTLLAGDRQYGVTVTDGAGGETEIGPLAPITIPPGYANARVMVSGLLAILSATAPGVVGAKWRLYVMIDGRNYQFLNEGSTDTFTDDGSVPVQCINPPTTGTTDSTYAVQITVPGGQDAKAVSANVYVSADGSFEAPCLLDNVVATGFGTARTYTTLSFQSEQPPPVNLSIGGANQINPDTDILNNTWKRPVTTETTLPVTLAAPTGVTATPSGSGGTLPTGTRYYVVTALNAQGETVGSAEVNAAVVGPTGSVAVAWSTVAGAVTGYRVYAGTAAGGENAYFSVAAGTTTFTDTGAAGIAGTPPTVNTALHGNSPGDARVTEDTGTIYTWTGATWVPQGSLTAGHIIRAAGVDQTQRGRLNFTGAAAVTDDAANGQTTVNVPGIEARIAALLGLLWFPTPTALGKAPSYWRDASGQVWLEGVCGKALAIPTGVVATPSTVGGALAAGTYHYVVTALNANGETIASADVSAITTTGTSSVQVNWTAVTGATGGYRVYRGPTAGGENVYFSVAAGTTTFTDTGGASTAGTPPAHNTASTTPAAGDIIIPTLPTNYRPSVQIPLSGAVSGDDATARGFASVDIDASGNVIWQAGQAGAHAWVSLTGLCFRP